MHSHLSVVLAGISFIGASHALPSQEKSYLPSQPLNGLPAPDSSLTLKYVALGLGWQNYTCANESTAPVSIGANAHLFDATTLLSSRVGSTQVATLPSAALTEWYDLGTPFVGGAPFDGLPYLGHHFFAGGGIPSFDLSTPGLFLSAEKDADVPAPSGSCPGPLKTGAVDWLYLAYNGSFQDVGLDAVYRVETAGGDPPTTCSTTGLVQIPYGAEYWFYG